MSFLLDTNVVSEIRKSHADTKVVNWVQSHRSSEFYLSVITIFEIQIGVSRLERRDPRQGEALRSWLDNQVLQKFEGRLLPLDIPVLRRAAAMHVPDPRSDRDCFIAATAALHGLTVVTRNTRDFEGTGVRHLNPWKER